MTIRRAALNLLALAALAGPAAAATSNGNDFALYLSEAKTPQERRQLFDDAKGRPHYFRYLQIMQMETKEGGGIDITAFEPASLMDVRFIVVKPVSREMLRMEPASKVGDAIAVTGVISGLSSNTLLLNPVIVRHKDILHPKRGKELMCDIDPTATFYSFTGGKRPVSLTMKDRDLLQYRDAVIAKEGRDGWGEFLERELAKREKARAEARAAEKKAAKAPAPVAPAAAELPE